MSKVPSRRTKRVYLYSRKRGEYMVFGGLALSALAVFLSMFTNNAWPALAVGILVINFFAFFLICRLIKFRNEYDKATQIKHYFFIVLAVVMAIIYNIKFFAVLLPSLIKSSKFFP